MDRRGFLKGGVLAAGAAVSAPLMGQIVQVEGHMSQAQLSQLGVEGGRPDAVRLGLASYTFRNFDRAQMIKWMKQLHINQLNCKDTKNHLPIGKTPGDFTAEDEALADYKANGITVHALGTLYFPKDEDDDIRMKFEYAKRAGVKVIVAGDPAPSTLPRIEKFVKEYDIKFAIHNHGPEDKIWHSPLDVLKVVKNMDPRMGCCIDIGHCMRAGTDVVKAIHEVGPRLFDMHAKDLTDYNSKDSQVAVGAGKMPMREIFQALAAVKYPGFVDLEYEVHGDDPMPGATESFAYMRGVLVGMGYQNELTS
jgi:sugar phosphate isomerase/epimerase